MKAILFDAGPIISLTTNNLLWILKKLKIHFGGEFYITKGVRQELVERPLNTKKFKFEALQVKRLLDIGVLRVYDEDKLSSTAEELLNLANQVFSVRGNNINIVQYAEMEILAACKMLNSSAAAVDERTTRYLVESPQKLESLLKRKLHTPVKVNKQKLLEFNNLVKGLRIIRSVELATIAFEKGLLDDYLTNIPLAKRTLLESVLWGVKLHGCAVSHLEIDRIVKLEMKR